MEPDIFALPRPLHPGRTYLVERYWGACQRCLDKGTPRVILVATALHFEPLAYSERNLRLARIVGRPGWKAAYAKETATRQLKEDLSDPDLFRLAHGALARRGRLGGKAILSAARRIEAVKGEESFNLLLFHLEQLKGAKRRGFIDRLCRAHSGGDRHHRLVQALRWWSRRVVPEEISIARRLIKALSYKEKAERRLLVQTLQGAIRAAQSRGTPAPAPGQAELCADLQQREPVLLRIARPLCGKKEP